ncbi:uncharacterized protein N7483_008575 [Penicillium malachiteum]|uniref:uncharacterized protein n=1 Tax=Penicillium malachiteum TaxID=1324776 RepID=UPI00254958B9|nr:uncharacterized protein N7483_008575 [Penicillium malachiteum]KAJ5720641.1 hypothetical protein N7483_008575 [Penicillium malachiteum]
MMANSTASMVQAWLENCATESAAAGQCPIPLFISSSPSITRKRHRTHCSDKIDPYKKNRTAASDCNSDASSQIPTLRDDSTFPSLSRPSSVGSGGQRSPSPARQKTLLANKNTHPRVIYVHEQDEPKNEAAKALLVYLSQASDWSPDMNKIKEASTGSRKCSTQQRSESSWVTEVTRIMLLLSQGEMKLEFWGHQNESVRSCYQPQYTARDRCNRKIDYVIGFPSDSWQKLYRKASIKFEDGYFNHVDHVHTGTQILGVGIQVKPQYGNRMEAEVQLGAWVAGHFLWAFEHRAGTEIPPPMVGIISVGETWDFYIIYGVSAEAIHDDPLSKLEESARLGPIFRSESPNVD